MHASHQAELLSLAIDLTNFNFVFIPRKHIIMESRDSQIVPVHSVPHTSDLVLSSGVERSTDIVPIGEKGQVVAARGDVAQVSDVPLIISGSEIARNTEEIVLPTATREGMPVEVKIRLEETQAKAAAIGLTESANGDKITVKGAAVQLHKKELAIEIDGHEVVRAELFSLYRRAFEAQLSRKQHTLAIDGEELPTYEPSGFETATYKCCQAYSCDFKGCCNRRCRLSRSDIKKSYEEPETFKKARPIGLNVIKDSFMSFLSTSLISELFLYLTVGIAFLEFIFSIASLATNQKSDQNDIILEILSFILSFIGITFTLLDLLLHFRHRGFRICARACQGQKSEQEDDEKKKEYCNETCVSKEKNSCGKKCVAILDVIRIFVLETIYYPDLLSTMFEFIDELIQNGHKPKAIPVISWLSFFWNMLLIIVTVYLAKIHTLWGLVYSVRKARAEKKFQGILFILTFALYMLGILILQALMISVIGGRYHHDHTAGEGKISGQLWYMMVSGYLTPLFGMIIFFVVHHFWTMKLPVDLVYDFIKVLQTEGVETDNTKRGQEELTKVEQILKYIGEEQFKKDYHKFQQTDCITKVGHPFSSPLHIIVISFYSAMLFVFCLCSLIGGPNEGAWLLFYFLAGFIGTIVNIYALAVFFTWLWIIISVLAALVLLIAMIIICIFICSMASSDSSQRR